MGHGVETRLLLLDGDMLVNCSCEYGEVILLLVAAEATEVAVVAEEAEEMDFSYLSLIFSAGDISKPEMPEMPEMTREPRFDADETPPISPGVGSTRSYG